MKAVRIHVKCVMEAGKWFNEKCEASKEDYSFNYFVDVKESYLKKIAKQEWISTHYGETWENIVDHDICRNGRKLSIEEISDTIGNSIQYDCWHYVLFSCLVPEIWKVARTYGQCS